MSDSTQKELISMRQAAAHYLAAAVCDLFPNTLLVGGLGTSRCFYCDCILPFVYSPEMLRMIEERMHALIREKQPIKMHEMLASNAAELMQHRKQFLIAEKLKNSRYSTVNVCQIGNFYNESFDSSFFTGDLKFFKLIEAFDLEVPGKSVLRIVGVLEEQKDRLKKIAKEFIPSSNNHLALAEKLEYFLPIEGDGWVWLPEAEVLRNQLWQYWRQVHLSQNFKLISTSIQDFDDTEQEMVQSHVACMLEKKFSKTAEICRVPFEDPLDFTHGIFSIPQNFSDRAYLHCSDEKLLEEVISSLQFIAKIPKILGFEFEMALSISSAGKKSERQKGVDVFKKALAQLGLACTTQKEYRPGIHARVDVQIFDFLGRKWSGPFLAYSDTMHMTGVKNLLIRSTFGSLERLMGLSLENLNGKRSISFPLSLEDFLCE